VHGRDESNSEEYRHEDHEEDVAQRENEPNDNPEPQKDKSGSQCPPLESLSIGDFLLSDHGARG
jgi:hypothetical protein